VDAAGDAARLGRGPTPNTDPEVPYRRAEFDSLCAALDHAARGRAGLNFYSSRGKLEHTLTYAALRDRARDLGERLRGMGLARGERVGIVADMHPDFIVGFFACQYAGLISVPLPVPTALGGREGYEDQLQRVLNSCGARVALTRDGLVESVQTAAAAVGVPHVLTVARLAELAPAADSLAPLAPGQDSHVQYSSGSTRHPLGIRISQDALMSNAASVARDGLKMHAADRCASWLPFYHDMGLIGFLLIPLTCQTSIDYMHTDGFARRPLQWLQLISDNAATIAFSPTFGYELCVRRAAKRPNLNLDLSNWRIAGIGGEMVRPEPLHEFAETFGCYGFRHDAFVPSYGLAEATLAVSHADLNTGVSVDVVDNDAVVDEAVARPARLNGGANGAGNGHADKKVNGHSVGGNKRIFAKCGHPMPGYSVAICDDAGNRLPERCIGRVLIAGPSLMSGYDGAPDATARSFDNGWLDTGDMGYLVGGELVLTGRRKDLIIVNGRNIWPQDLEWHAEAASDEVRSRDTAAFAVTDEYGREVPLLLVQCRTQDPAAIERLRRTVHAAVFRNTGTDCRVVMVPPRSLPFTTSGKLSRAKARQGYVKGTIAEIAEPEATPAGAQPAARAAASPARE